MSKANFKIGDMEIGLDAPLFVMAGPCVIEDKIHCLNIANRLVDVSVKSDVGIIFKASFDKANRSSLQSFRGPGMEKGLEILAAVREDTGLPVMTDVHEPAQADFAGEVVDCLQVPAFLCRQTDLLCACARTGKPVNVK
ncbi:MAG: 3-deoxy-8-phosphooctulonate synthase, partial [Planctomycetota bacterium]